METVVARSTEWKPWEPASQDSRRLGRDSSLELPECKSRALLFVLHRTVRQGNTVVKRRIERERENDDETDKLKGWKRNKGEPWEGEKDETIPVLNLVPLMKIYGVMKV
jgi:hypothetical protein